MKITYTSAGVQIDVDLTGGTTLPIIDNPGLIIDSPGYVTMSVEKITLKYFSEDGRPWVPYWTCSGYSTATGHTLLDLNSHQIPRRDWPGWVNDLVASSRPKTGDRILPAA